MAYSNLGIYEPTPQDPSQTNVWAATINTNMTLIDNAVAGFLPVNVAGNSNVILTATAGTPNQARNATFLFTGLLTGDIVILWPTGVTQHFAAINATTGAFTITLASNNGSGAAAGVAIILPQGATGQFSTDGTDVYSASSSFVTRQLLTTGSGATYTTGVGCTRIEAYCVGGGGGGGGAGDSFFNGGAGGVGGTTFFNAIGAAGGGAGGPGTGPGAANAGASGTGGSGAAFRQAGFAGGPGTGETTSGGPSSANGGTGGGPGGGVAQNAGRVNTGGGGGGGSIASNGAGGSGGGGGSAETALVVIYGPAATYTYTIGAGGTAGTASASGASAGAAGGTGYILVTEYY